MEKETVQYKRTLKGSVGAGVNALFNGNGRRYFILEHKDASRLHRAGESQKFIIDQVELGRDKNCQVQFGEDMITVSRRHAAIIREGDRWKLIQLSKTNSTFLNGRPIESQWYLENGDEIQLSVGGPRMGFIVPEGKQSLVSSIKMSERLELFRKQALKPYRTAIACICAFVVIVAGTAGWVLSLHDKEIKEGEQVNKEQTALIEKQDSTILILKDSLTQMNLDLVAYQKRAEARIASMSTRMKGITPPEQLSKMVEESKPYVYFVKTTIHIEADGTDYALNTYAGTGFLLNDGRFVTARHCVKPWLYSNAGDEDELKLNLIAANNIHHVYAVIEAESMTGDYLRFTSEDFRTDDSYDAIIQTENGRIHYGTPLQTEDGMQYGSSAMYGSDWAYATTSGKTGGLLYDAELSRNIKAATEVHVLGFPGTLGVKDGDKKIEPIYNNMTVSRTGLNDQRCIMIKEGVAHGNSGGPIFIAKNGKFVVVAIVSRKETATQQEGLFGIIQQQQQYDQLVPLCNLK